MVVFTREMASEVTAMARERPARRLATVTRVLWVLLGICIVGMPSQTCCASDLRYQLGKRVQRFEAAWEHKDSPEARARVLAPLQAAVSAFFSGNQAGAGKAIDQACLALDDEPASAEQQLWHSLNVSLASPLVPLGTPEVELRIERSYKLTETPDPAGSLQVALLQGEQVCVEGETSWTHLSQAYTVPTADLPAGDYRLRVRLKQGERLFELPTQLLSVTADPAKRLAKLAEQEAALPEATHGSPRRTLRDTVRELKGLLGASRPETDYPAHALLEQCETWSSQLFDGEAVRLATGPGQYWISPQEGRQSARCRLLWPSKLGSSSSGTSSEEQSPSQTPGPRPLVIALHGAGGSENMFFDAYGAGKIVRLCEERGWLLLAPRLSPLTGTGLDLPGLIAAVDALHPVDRRQVYVVGHSMGAMQGLNLTARHPEVVRRLAILGGGQRVRQLNAFQQVPLFAGAGAEDFGRGGVQQVARQFRQAGLSLDERDYPQVEHLGIVQVALEDVFRFFEAGGQP
jgi:pimeloyl-ACP methyl ester carboxylesterase